MRIQSYMLKQGICIKSLFLICALFVMIPALSFADTVESQSTDVLADQVAKLKLGFNDYIIGTFLTKEQKIFAGKNPVEGAYEGTYKFKDSEVYVVVSAKNDMILAIYQRKEEGSREDMQKMVGFLMMEFEEPTTMAHDQIIYWAYNKDGKITEELYEAAKATGKLDILATVKFKSNITSLQSDPEAKETATLYTIITSEPLVQRFMNKEKSQ